MIRSLAFLLLLAACRPPQPTPALPVEEEAFPDLGPMQVPAEFLVEVPFKRQRGLVVVEAQVEGIDRPLRLAIDSGAPTVLRQRVADEMRVAQGSEVSADDAEGRGVAARPLQIPKLRIGELEVGRVAGVSIALPILDRFCPPLDGVLGVGLDIGSGFLDKVVTEIDPEKETVRFADSGEKLRPGGFVAPLRRRRMGADGEETLVTQFATRIYVGDQELWVTLDTGNNADIDVPRKVFEKLGYRVDGDDVVARHGALSFSAGGISESESWVARLRTVRIGDHTFSSLPVNVTGGDEGSTYDILLGQSLFRKYVLVMDYPRKQVRYIATAEAPSGDPQPEVGFGWEEVEGKVRVLSLLEGSPAQQAGVALGDEVIRVAGVDVSVENPQSLCDARTAELDAEGPVGFTLRRPDGNVELTLERKPPLPPL